MTYAVDFAVDLGTAQSGLTLLATIKTMAGGAFASGVSGWTEDPVASGVYWGTVSSFADGVSYRVQWFSAGALVAVQSVAPSDAAVPVDSAAIATLAGYVDTEVAAIKAKTDNLPANPAAVGSAMTLDLTQAIPNGQALGTVGDALVGAEINGGPWSIVGNQLILKRRNGSTWVTLTLDSVVAPTSRA